MSKKSLKLLIVLALGAGICFPGVALANFTIGFDDVTDGVLQTPPYTTAALPTNYLGFSWSSTGSGFWGVVDNASYRTGISGVVSWNNNFDFPSNPNAVLNEDGNVGAPRVTLARTTPFNLVSAYFGDWTQNSINNFFGASSLTLTGYLNGVQVGLPLTFNLSPGPLQFQAINFTGVDKVTFDATSGGAGYYFLMDNMVSNVPLPPSALLVGTGILGLVGLGWRRRKTKV